MPLLITYIAGCHKQLMIGVYRFRPLLRDEPGSVVLRSALADLITIVDHEHMIRSPTVFACRMRRGIRKVVIVMRGLATRSQETAEGVRQPESSEDVHRSLASMVIGFRVEQGNL